MVTIPRNYLLLKTSFRLNVPQAWMSLTRGTYLLPGDLEVGEYSVDIECLLLGEGLLLSPTFLDYKRLHLSFITLNSPFKNLHISAA